VSATGKGVGIDVGSGGRVASNKDVAVGMLVGISVNTMATVGEVVADGTGVGVSTSTVASTTGVDVEVLKLATFTVDVGAGLDPTELSLKPHANNSTNK
jgi:hypothetical protein